MLQGQPRFALVLTCGAALALHGFFDTLVYAYPRAVRSQLKEVMRQRGCIHGVDATRGVCGSWYDAGRGLVGPLRPMN